MHLLAVLLVTVVAQDAESANAEPAADEEAPLVVNVVNPEASTAPPEAELPPTKSPEELVAPAKARPEVKEAALKIVKANRGLSPAELTNQIIADRLALTTAHPTTPFPTTPSPGVTKDRISAGWSRIFPDLPPSPTTGPSQRLFVPAHNKTDVAKDVIKVSAGRIPDWEMDWRSEQIDADHEVLDVTPLRKEFSDIRRAIKAESIHRNRDQFYPDLRPLVDKLTALDNPTLIPADPNQVVPCPVGDMSRCWPKPVLAEKSKTRSLRGGVSR